MSIEKKRDKHGILRDEKGLWVKGQSANPKGRPKGWTLTEIIRKELERVPKGQKEDQATKLARNYIKEAIAGEPVSKKLVINYLDGMPKQNVKQEHQGQLKIEISESIAKRYGITQEPKKDS